MKGTNIRIVVRVSITPPDNPFANSGHDTPHPSQCQSGSRTRKKGRAAFAAVTLR
jgi:hypothetical protein